MDKTQDYLDDELDIEDLSQEQRDVPDEVQQRVRDLGGRGKKKKTGGLGVALAALVILLVILLIALVIGTIYSRRLAQSAEGDAETGGTQIGESLSTESDETKENSVVEIKGLSDEEILEKLTQEFENGRTEGANSILDSIRLALTDGTTVVETLRPLYKDYLVVASSGKYHFVPVNDAMKKNEYVEENLIQLENGEMQYGADGQVTSYKGIDVSKFQGDIDWQKVAADGVSFAFVRAGYRGYGTNGTLVEDTTAAANLQGANEAGVKVGVYFYTQAITRDEILEEARLVLDLIAPYRIDCPVVIDVEKVANANGRMNDLSAELRTELVKLFCETIQAAGYKPMIYHNLEMGALMLNLDQLEEYDKWFAYYRPELYYPYAYKVWQYSDKGRVDGISAAVDLNIAFEPIW